MPMNATTLRTLVRIATGVLALALLAVAAGSRIHTRRVEQAARDRCAAFAAKAAGGIQAGMADIQRIADDLAAALEAGAVTPAQAQAEVAAALGKAPAAIQRMGILFRPGTAGPGPFGPYAERDGQGVRAYRYESHQDYSAQAWFRREPWTAGWEEPGFSHRGGGLMVVYARPFRLPGADRPSGLVRLDVTLEAIRSLVSRLDLGYTGYGFLLSAKGVYLDDPRDELVQERKSIQDMARSTQDPGRRRLAAMVERREGGFTESVSGVTGQRTWVVLQHLPGLDWSLGLVYIRDELHLDPPWARWIAALEISLGLAATLGLLFLALGGHRDDPRRHWAIVVAGSIAILAAIALVFRQVNLMPIPERDSDFSVMDDQSLERFQDLHRTRQAAGHSVPVTLVPTGVTVQTLELTGAGQVKVTGQIWQRYPKGTPREQRGVVFPEATAGEATPGIEREEGDAVVQYYSYRAVLRMENDSANRYPFDRTRIRLRIWPRQFLTPTLPVPDLASYPVPSPGSLPGVDPEIELPGWDLEATDFSYTLETYNTLFGAEAMRGRKESPELLYNLTLKRRFVSPCIAAFLPILAVAALLFTLVLTVSLQSDKVKATGYSYLNFLRTTIALFFSLVVAQFNIRARVVADGVIWMEWYFFIMYGAILVTSVNALVFALRDHPLLRHGDNAVAKLGFWPTLLGAFYLNTLMYLI